MGAETLLDKLRAAGAVDCDTFDVDVAKELGPFVDCTSNQAIAYHELTRISTTAATGSKDERVHEKLIRDSVALASSLPSSGEIGGAEKDLFGEKCVSKAELAVEVMMVKLALHIVPHLTGYSHVQTNTKYSYDRRKTVQNGRRIVAIFKVLDPSYDAKRVCIKIPATWEGMQACRELEAEHGIATLATTMFCKEQAALAAHVGCTYIAPYVNELRVHFDAGYVDEAKAFGFSGAAQKYYEKTGSKTQVLPASLTSIQEVMMLAGSHHITVSPPLLKKLSETPADPWADAGLTGSVLASAEAAEGASVWVDKADKGVKLADIVEDEAAWRLAFTRSLEGKAEGKIVQAINIFCEKQEGLEELARAV